MQKIIQESSKCTGIINYIDDYIQVFNEVDKPLTGKNGLWHFSEDIEKYKGKTFHIVVNEIKVLPEMKLGADIFI